MSLLLKLVTLRRCSTLGWSDELVIRQIPADQQEAVEAVLVDKVPREEATGTSQPSTMD